MSRPSDISNGGIRARPKHAELSLQPLLRAMRSNIRYERACARQLAEGYSRRLETKEKKEKKAKKEKWR